MSFVHTYKFLTFGPASWAAPIVRFYQLNALFLPTEADKVGSTSYDKLWLNCD